MDYCPVIFGNGHYLWTGGERSQKGGGGENIFRFKEEPSKKNEEAMSGRLKNFLPKIAASFLL